MRELLQTLMTSFVWESVKNSRGSEDWDVRFQDGKADWLTLLARPMGRVQYSQE